MKKELENQHEKMGNKINIHGDPRIHELAKKIKY